MRIFASKISLFFAGSGLMLAARADAHVLTTTWGPVYDSALQVFTNPENFAPVIALAAFAGLRGARHARWALFVVTAAWLLGSNLGLDPPASAAMRWTATACIILGSLLAADLMLPMALTPLLAAAVGLLGGGIIAAARGPPSSVEFTWASSATVFIVSALTASLVVPLRKPWLRLGIRVAGSWLAALGLLLVGWQIRSAR